MIYYAIIKFIMIYYAIKMIYYSIIWFIMQLKWFIMQLNDLLFNY